MSEVIRCPDAHQTMWKALGDKDYREAYAEAFVGDFLASQIHALRTARGWNQTELADKAEATQPMICKWEKSCEGVRLASLHKLASAFDVALVVKFVPFSTLAREAISSRADEPVSSFDDDSREAIGFGAVRVFAPETRMHVERNGGPSDYLQVRPDLYSGASTRAARL